jgi:hypothetical protein
MSSNSESHAITANALVRKRAEILFEIGQLEQRIERAQTELAHLTHRIHDGAGFGVAEVA